MIEIKIIPKLYNYIVFLDHIRKIADNMNDYKFKYEFWNRETSDTFTLLWWEE